MTRRLWIDTVGCQMNVLDSELVVAALRRQGWQIAASPAEADAVFYNTCSVRQHAEDKVYSALGRVRAEKAKRPDLVVGVLGCMAQKDQELVRKRAPWVDLVVGPGQLHRVPSLINGVLAGSGPMIEVSLDRTAGNRESVARSFESYDPDRDPQMRPTPFQAFIRTQTGCDKFCAFCVVPRVRGPEQARPPAAILAEAKKLVDEGCREITLIGQTVNSYRWSDGGRTTRLADLLIDLDAIDGLDRIRFVTNYPRDMTDDLIHAVRDLPKVCHYLHVPAQHGCDNVLKRMKRGYTIGEYLEMHGRMMEAIPHAAVTSDFIVGFCGETDEEFERMLKLVQDLRFKNSFIFKYSPRPGTKAYQRQPDDVPESVKKARHRLLLDAQTEASMAGNLPLVGSRQQVLVEGVSRRDEKQLEGHASEPAADDTLQLSGRTMCDRIVVFDAPRRLIGRIVDVDILAAGPWAVSGSLAIEGTPPGQVADEPLMHSISLPRAAEDSAAAKTDASKQASESPKQAGHANRV